MHQHDGTVLFLITNGGKNLLRRSIVPVLAINTAVNGVLDTKSYADEINRSWIFRSVGFGNGESYWRDVISNLRMVGYDGVLSIEHEDSLMSQNEGLSKAVSFLKNIILTESTGEMWWV